MSDEQLVSRCCTDQDDWFNAIYECALASRLLSMLFAQSELERIFANASQVLESRVRSVQFLLGSFDELARLVRDRFLGFFVGKKTTQKFGGSPIITGGR